MTPKAGLVKFMHNHRDVAVHSVINVHLWDKAGWHATAFLGYGPRQPPALALVFKDRQAAEDIFRGWRDRFGDAGESNELYVAIVRGISTEDPHDYTVLVTSRPPAKQDHAPGKVLSVIARVICTRHRAPTSKGSSRLTRRLALMF